MSSPKFHDITNTIVKQSKYLDHKNISPTTYQEAISLLKKQIRSLKNQLNQQRVQYKEELDKYKQQIQELKRKILYLTEKDYLKTIFVESQEVVQKDFDQMKYNKLKVYAQKLQSCLKQSSQKISQKQEQISNLTKKITNLQRQKQKHLELSIYQKIGLQQRIQILEKQVRSKQGLLSQIKLRNQGQTTKSLQLKNVQRRIAKKLRQLQAYEKEVQNLNRFQKQKLLKKVQGLERENEFLKSHIDNIEKHFNEIGSCECNKVSCKEQVELFKNKYISKTRQLSKVRLQMAKQVFRQRFAKEVQSRDSDGKSVGNWTIKFEGKDKSEKEKEDQYLFKLTENDEDEFGGFSRSELRNRSGHSLQRRSKSRGNSRVHISERQNYKPDEQIRSKQKRREKQIFTYPNSRIQEFKNSMYR